MSIDDIIAPFSDTMPTLRQRPASHALVEIGQIEPGLISLRLPHADAAVELTPHLAMEVAAALLKYARRCHG